MIVILTTVYCDGDECFENTDAVSDTIPRRKKAWSAAVEMGWRKTTVRGHKGNHFCPDCTKEVQEKLKVLLYV